MEVEAEDPCRSIHLFGVGRICIFLPTTCREVRKSGYLTRFNMGNVGFFFSFLKDRGDLELCFLACVVRGQKERQKKKKDT